jgi:starch-binding outer membrane protein, SusD/RagB family
MKKYIAAALTTAMVATSACKDSTDVLPLDAPTIESVTSKPLVRSSLQTLATGVLAQDRSGVVGTGTYLVLANILARNAIRVDTSEPRYVQETLGTNPDPGSFAGSGGFAGFYTAIRAVQSILAALPGAVEGSFDDDEVAATKGFMRTIEGLDYMRLIELRDTVGIPIQAADNETVSDVSCKSTVLNFIAALLDSANTDLAAASPSATVPFVLPTGLTTFGRDYSVVSNIQKFNRAVKGKVDVYRAINRKNPQTARATDAIAELTFALGGAAPGAVPASQFSVGPYYKFVSTGSEATPNNVSDSRLALNMMAADSIRGTDTRKSKIITRSTLSGVNQGLLFTSNTTCAKCTATTANQEAPLGILRDEELVLLRAQAYIEAGNLTAATADLNSVTTAYGNPPYAVFATKAEAITQVLYEKRYSLLMEGPQRLVDLREYGRLRAPFLRAETATDPYNAAFPLSRPELNARGVQTNPECVGQN